MSKSDTNDWVRAVTERGLCMTTIFCLKETSLFAWINIIRVKNHENYIQFLHIFKELALLYISLRQLTLIWCFAKSTYKTSTIKRTISPLHGHRLWREYKILYLVNFYQPDFRALLIIYLPLYSRFNVECYHQTILSFQYI